MNITIIVQFVVIFGDIETTEIGYIEMAKKSILRLLDESVYDKEKRELLNEKILEAIKKW